MATDLRLLAFYCCTRIAHVMSKGQAERNSASATGSARATLQDGGQSPPTPAAAAARRCETPMTSTNQSSALAGARAGFRES